MTNFLINFWIHVTVFNGTWLHGWVHKAGVIHAFKSNWRELSTLAFVNVDNSMKVRFSTSANSKESIKFGIECQSWWDTAVEESSSRVSYFSSVPKKDTAHQDLTLNEVVLSFGEDLSHDTTERVCGEIDLLSTEAMFLLESRDHSINLVVDSQRLWNIKWELRCSNPCLVSVLASFSLELFGNGFIGFWLALHTVNPNDCDFSTVLDRWLEDHIRSRNI